MKWRIASAPAWGSSERRSASGMTMWFEIMVDSAIEETMTIEVAEEKPPRKASKVSVL